MLTKKQIIKNDTRTPLTIQSILLSYSFPLSLTHTLSIFLHVQIPPAYPWPDFNGCSPASHVGVLTLPGITSCLQASSSHVQWPSGHLLSTPSTCLQAPSCLLGAVCNLNPHHRHNCHLLGDLWWQRRGFSPFSYTWDDPKPYFLAAAFLKQVFVGPRHVLDGCKTDRHLWMVVTEVVPPSEGVWGFLNETSSCWLGLSSLSMSSHPSPATSRLVRPLPPAHRKTSGWGWCFCTVNSPSHSFSGNLQAIPTIPVTHTQFYKITKKVPQKINWVFIFSVLRVILISFFKTFFIFPVCLNWACTVFRSRENTSFQEN